MEQQAIPQAVQQASRPAESAARPLRVFIVDDSSLVRDRVQAMVAAAGGEAVGCAGKVNEAIEAILHARPDMVILDMQLADGTGFDVLRALRGAAPGIDVYFLSNFAADPYRQLAERLGARGFYDKSNEFGRMRDVVAERAARH